MRFNTLSAQFLLEFLRLSPTYWSMVTTIAAYLKNGAIRRDAPPLVARIVLNLLKDNAFLEKDKTLEDMNNSPSLAIGCYMTAEFEAFIEPVGKDTFDLSLAMHVRSDE